jgi:hypothetical protein
VIRHYKLTVYVNFQRVVGEIDGEIVFLSVHRPTPSFLRLLRMEGLRNGNARSESCAAFRKHLIDSTFVTQKKPTSKISGKKANLAKAKTGSFVHEPNSRYQLEGEMNPKE